MKTAFSICILLISLNCFSQFDNWNGVSLHYSPYKKHTYISVFDYSFYSRNFIGLDCSFSSFGITSSSIPVQVQDENYMTQYEYQHKFENSFVYTLPDFNINIYPLIISVTCIPMSSGNTINERCCVNL